MKNKYLYLPRVRLYSDDQRDREIQEWLSKLPKGAKSETIKEAIWASIKQQPGRTFGPSQPLKPETARINSTSTMRAEVTFDTHELLADIRQIVEVGVTSALGHLNTNPSQNPPPPREGENEKEIEAMLDDLDMSFMLDDDDDEEEL